MDRRQFLGEAAKRLGFVLLGAAAGTVARNVILKERSTGPLWLGPEGDYTGV